MLGFIRQTARVRPTNLFSSCIMRQQQFLQTRKVSFNTYYLFFVTYSFEKKFDNVFQTHRNNYRESLVPKQLRSRLQILLKLLSKNLLFLKVPALPKLLKKSSKLVKFLQGKKGLGSVKLF